MSDLPRTQHIIASGLVAAVGAWVTYVSYTQTPSEAFLFPRLISNVFVVLALWTFGKAILGKTKVGNGLSGEAMRHFDVKADQFPRIGLGKEGAGVGVGLIADTQHAPGRYFGKGGRHALVSIE